VTLLGAGGNPVALMASEVRDKLDEIINEFGDCPAFTPDMLEPKWHNPLTDIQHDRDGERIYFISD
jgi:hypothetical protein